MFFQKSVCPACSNKKQLDQQGKIFNAPKDGNFMELSEKEVYFLSNAIKKLSPETLAGPHRNHKKI